MASVAELDAERWAEVRSLLAGGYAEEYLAAIDVVAAGGWLLFPSSRQCARAELRRLHCDVARVLGLKIVEVGPGPVRGHRADRVIRDEVWLGPEWEQ